MALDHRSFPEGHNMPQERHERCGVECSRVAWEDYGKQLVDGGVEVVPIFTESARFLQGFNAFNHQKMWLKLLIPLTGRVGSSVSKGGDSMGIWPPTCD